jgi:hypothetical protein
VTRRAGYQLIADSPGVEGRKSPAIRGHFTLEELLALLLGGTGLMVAIHHHTVFVRRTASGSHHDTI